MPTLRYTTLSDYKRSLSSATFSALVFDDRRDIEWRNLPDNPFDIDGFDEAAYALLEAERDVEGYLSAQVNVPLDRMPEHIKGRLIDIAAYKLHNRMRGSAPDNISGPRDEAISYLEDVKEGMVDLNLTSDEGSAHGGSLSSGEQADSVFSDLP